MSEEQNKYRGFACSCGEKNKAACAETHAKIAEIFWKGRASEEDASFYVTKLLYILAGNYRAWIEGVPLDPGGWGAVTVKGGPKDDPLETYVQFDRFEDGLAETVLAFHAKYGRSIEEEAEW